MIWEEADYQATLKAQMENDAREWVKNKINGSEKIEKCEPTIE